jgi:hypothetical protein
LVTILVLEDKLGITAGYMDMWENMVIRVGLLPQMFRRYSLYKSPVVSHLPVLIQKGNRKAPGFNPDSQVATQVRHWFAETVNKTLPQMIIVMDAALLGIFEPNWDNATIDNMRGGVYQYKGATVLIMTPISAVNRQRQLKDVRAMNDGAESKTEWEEEEHDPEELYIEPYTIRSGKWIFQRDLAKLARLTKGK